MNAPNPKPDPLLDTILQLPEKFKDTALVTYHELLMEKKAHNKANNLKIAQLVAELQLKDELIEELRLQMKT
jgi:hypothetical protein